MSDDVRYSLDGNDRICRVNDAWTRFADQNDGSELTASTILGRSVWEFVVDDTTVHLYRLLFERVRAGSGPVTFPLRCDSPTARRFLEMTIAAGPDGRIDADARTVLIEPRSTVALLDRFAPRSDVVIRMCAWCKRIPDMRGVWLEVESALPRLGLFASSFVPMISHGICEACYAAVLDLIENADGAVRLRR